MILVTVCIALFMAPFMLTSVGVALPSLGRDLGATAMQLGLVEQLYVLSLAMSMLSFGRFGDIVGQRRLFLVGLCVFTLLTFSLGFADSVRMVMIFRFVQGIGASLVLSGSMALVAAAYPPELRARKIGLDSACTYAGLSTGPVIGGYVTLHFGWRHVFLSCRWRPRRSPAVWPKGSTSPRWRPAGCLPVPWDCSWRRSPRGRAYPYGWSLSS